MGRKAGGKNFGNFTEDITSIELTETERVQLPKVFTSFNKDFISVQDLIDSSGLSYNTCAKIVREIKSVSDIFNIAGYVHRTDYYLYLSRRFATKINQEA